MNLARNIGGSVGISVVTTMLDRRTQVHRNFLASHLSASNPALQARLKALGLMVQAHGGGPPGSSPVPWALIQGEFSDRPRCWPILMTFGFWASPSWPWCPLCS